MPNRRGTRPRQLIPAGAHGHLELHITTRPEEPLHTATRTQLRWNGHPIATADHHGTITDPILNTRLQEAIETALEGCGDFLHILNG